MSSPVHHQCLRYRNEMGRAGIKGGVLLLETDGRREGLGR